MRVPTGGEFSLRWSEPVGGGTDGSGTWTLGFSQPLLRGFGPAVDTAPVRLARIREKMNVLVLSRHGGRHHRVRDSGLPERGPAAPVRRHQPRSARPGEEAAPDQPFADPGGPDGRTREHPVRGGDRESGALAGGEREQPELGQCRAARHSRSRRRIPGRPVGRDAGGRDAAARPAAEHRDRVRQPYRLPGGAVAQGGRDHRPQSGSATTSSGI